MTILKNLSKRGLALFLVLTMCVSLLPAAALAEELEPDWVTLDAKELYVQLGGQEDGQARGTNVRWLKENVQNGNGRTLSQVGIGPYGAALTEVRAITNDETALWITPDGQVLTEQPEVIPVEPEIPGETGSGEDTGATEDGNTVTEDGDTGRVP